MSRPRAEEDPLERAVWERMDMAAANILGVKDRCELNQNDGARLRGVILRELNDFAELCISLLAASVDSAQVNELAIDMIRDIHHAVVNVPVSS